MVAFQKGPIRPSPFVPGVIWKLLALALLTALSASVLHDYQGLVGDGQLYAFQALSKLYPGLTADLYFQNISQDKYTVFSFLYAGFIKHLGIETAARMLFVVFTAWLLLAAWYLTAILTDRWVACFAIICLLAEPRSYGGSGVFQFGEQFLTARLPAEAMVVTALATFAHGKKTLAILIGVVGILIHPLIALPGILLLTLISLPARVATLTVLAGLAGVLVVALSSIGPWLLTTHLVMSTDWLDIVQERSQFLFLQLWTARDWETNVRPFLYLLFAASSLASSLARRLCGVASLVGWSGLGIAAVGGLIGPIAILVQGQAWRWVWIALLIAGCLTPSLILRASKEPIIGWLCAELLLSAWFMPPNVAIAALLLAETLWVCRHRIPSHVSPIFSSLALGAMLAIAVWIAITFGKAISQLAWRDGVLVSSETQTLANLRPAVTLICMGLLKWIKDATSQMTCALMTGAVAIALFFTSNHMQLGIHAHWLTAKTDQLSEWSSKMPPSATVLVAPARDAGAFVWFVLQRPNYLALNQSAGVVFSRATALEVARRSEVLMPITNPSWKIRSHLVNKLARESAPTRPLTSESIVAVCMDPKLDFIISPVTLAFHPIPFKFDGPWKGWNLYDCSRIRS